MRKLLLLWSNFAAMALNGVFNLTSTLLAQRSLALWRRPWHHLMHPNGSPLATKKSTPFVISASSDSYLVLLQMAGKLWMGSSYSNSSETKMEPLFAGRRDLLPRDTLLYMALTTLILLHPPCEWKHSGQSLTSQPFADGNYIRSTSSPPSYVAN